MDKPKEEKAYLVLGCFGRVENNFALCNGVENRILKLSDSLYDFPRMMDYFDSVRLFDRPMLDQNAINHLIYNLQDRFDQKTKRLWTDHYYHLLERFVQMHKPCGMFAKIIVTASEEEVKNDNLSNSFISVKGKVNAGLIREPSIINMQAIRSKKYL